MSEVNLAPAFPRNYDSDGHNGMTLRDYFAAKAMQGDLIGGLHREDFGVTAKRAYIMADEMMKARES